ncbi:hypothetical protein J4232_04755 [Candidatus Woesearchaeota archaeon]|nr:hypothetical protein [Candidatus Woesearchaeota archaeon]
MQAYSTLINCEQCNNKMKFVLFDNGQRSLIEGYHCYCCGMNRLRERCL